MTYHRESAAPDPVRRARPHPVERSLPLCILALLLILPDAALAGDNIFGSDSPLTKFVDFVTGPFAYLVVIVALVATVGVLALGGEFSGFSRRMPIVVVAGGIVILAQTVLGTLFGSGRAANLPPEILPHIEARMDAGRSADWPAQGTVSPLSQERATDGVHR